MIVGVAIPRFGLLAFALYSFAWVATKRTTLAAAIALAVAGAATKWLALPAILDQLAGRNPF